MKIIVTAPHQSKFPEPLELKVGDHPELGRLSEEPNWPNWIWAEQDGRNGWVPMQILDKSGMVTENYSAKELNLSGGEELLVTRIMNGWYWAQRLDNEEWGWLPMECARRKVD
jgi:hypothetical protein